MHQKWRLFSFSRASEEGLGRDSGMANGMPPRNRRLCVRKKESEKGRKAALLLLPGNSIHCGRRMNEEGDRSFVGKRGGAGDRFGDDFGLDFANSSCVDLHKNKIHQT